MFDRSHSKTRTSRFKVLITAGATALAVLSAAPAMAASHNVLCPTDSLQAAIDAADPGDSIFVTGVCNETILIDKDLNIGGGYFEGFIDGGDRGSVVTIAPGVGVTLNGLTIRNGRAVQGGGIFNYGDLYIHDSSVEGNVLFDGLGDPSQMAGAGVYNAPGATLWLREVWVTGNEGVSGAGGVENAGDATLEDCWIQGNWSIFDTGGVENRGTMSVSGCEISGNNATTSSTSQGPGGLGNWGTMSIAYSSVDGNVTAGGHGGGISNAGTLTMNGSQVLNNRARFGGGVAVTDAGSFEATDSTITGNRADRQGGGIHLDSDTTASLTRTFVSQNSATTGGGGAAVWWNASLTGDSADFDSNHASIDRGAGAGIFVIGGTVELTSSRIWFNSPAVTGGGISMTSRAEVSLVNTTVAYNDAQWEGGGIHNYQSTLSLVGSSIESNVARDGGGLSSTNDEGIRSTLTLVDTAVFDNQATRWGGGIYNVAAELDISHSAITGNAAGEAGGGLFNKRGGQQATAELRNTTVGDNVAPAGAGVFNRYADLALIHVTLTRSGGGEALGGVWSALRAPNVLSSILAGNQGGDCESTDNIVGGYSVVGDCTISFGNGDVTGVDDPQLDPQFATAGYLELYMPRPLSPAVDRVPTASCRETIDQQFTARPIGAGCDSGSVEREQLVDTEDPSVAVGFPFNATFTEVPFSVFGTATDDTGVEHVRVAIRDRTTGLWLAADMTSWGPFHGFAAELSHPGETATDWSLALSLPDGQFSLDLLVRDIAGNEAILSPWHEFQVAAVDSVFPTVDADYPQNTVFRTDPVVLTGTATDNVGVATVLIAIRHRASGKWLQADMTSWGPFYRFGAELSDPGMPATAWSFEVSLPNGGYTTSLHSMDLSGNETEMPRWRRFEVRL